MGWPRKFHKPLTRKAIPSWPRAATGGGRHKGIQPPNVPWDLFVACANGDGIDAVTFQALHTSIDLDGLYDLIEMSDAAESWKSAAIMNTNETRGNT